MKRCIIVTIFVILVILLALLVVSTMKEDSSAEIAERFVQIGISKGGPGSYGIVYMDQETGVLYFKCDGYKRQAMTVLFDENGPLVFKGEIPEDKNNVIVSFKEGTYSAYYGGYIYVDEARNVVYLYDNGYHRASMTVLLKADGTPILEGE